MTTAGQKTLDRYFIEPANSLLHYGYSVIKIPGRPLARMLHRLGITANQVTGARLLAPFIFYWPDFESWWFKWWFFSTLISLAYTDVIDGILATEFEKKSTNDGGVLFDSLVDKCFVVSVYWYPSKNFPKLFWFTLIGELLQIALATAWMLYSKSIENVRSNLAGKTKMTLEVLTGGLMILFLAFPSQPLSWFIVLCGTLALMFLGLSIMGKIKLMLD